MDWIAVSDRLPTVPEQVLVTDGYDIRRSHVSQNASGMPYFILDNTDFIVIWWAPFADGYMACNLDRYTEKPRNIFHVDSE